MRFKDKHIVILGGTSGIGFAVARAALDEGASVCVASKRQARVDEARAGLVSRFSATVMAESVDVTSEAALKDFFASTGQFDHLVLTAGEDLPLGLLVDKDLV